MRDTPPAEAPADINRRLGDHLRGLRKQKGLSLLEVEAVSGAEFKASVLGAYERGERAVSTARLARLAELYRLPLQAMLPPDGAAPKEGSPATGVAFDLGRLEAATASEAKTITRYVRLLQSQRQDWTGRVFRIRAEDVRALASALDRSPGEFVKLLDELGVRAY
ncbi:MAG: transcriptional regulator [Actinomycetota bacterium]